MRRKSIAQEYFVLAINKNGYMPAMRREESEAGIVAAGIMDLLLNHVIVVEKKKISVLKDIPDELMHLMPLYTYLKEKPRSIDKLMDDYLASTGRRLRGLMKEIGESLLADGAAVKGEGGIFGNKTVYIPEKSCKQEVAGLIRAAVTKEDEMTPHDIALIYILKETKNLNQYFSDSERKEWKGKLNAMKNDPQNKQLAAMINYVGDMTAIMAAFIVTSTCK